MMKHGCSQQLQNRKSVNDCNNHDNTDTNDNHNDTIRNHVMCDGAQP